MTRTTGGKIMKQNEKEFARREKVAEKLAKIGVHVEAIHPNGPSGYMYAVDGRLCRDYRDAMQYMRKS
jgi:hypothetical protein